MTWTSTCRPRSTYGSAKTSSSPKAPAASADAAVTSCWSSGSSRTIRIPRPPPPAAAFSSRGRSAAVAAAGSTGASRGTSAAAISSLALVLEAISSMALTGGPTQTSPASCTARAKPAFSERKPYPGCTASAPAASAAATRRSPRRYVSPGAYPGRRTAVSASRTCRAPASASEYTATVEMPSSRQVRKIRQAISPRLATSSAVIIRYLTSGRRRSPARLRPGPCGSLTGTSRGRSWCRAGR